MVDDPVAIARATVPGIILWGNLLHIPLAFAATRGLTHLGIWVAMRRPPDPSAPWPERARIAQPARAVVRWSRIVIPFVFGAEAALLRGPFSVVPAPVSALAAFVAAFVAVEQSARRLERVLGLKTSSSLVTRLKNAFSFVVIAAPHVLVAGVCTALASRQLRSWAVLAALIPLLALGAAGFGLDLARWVGWARPASKRLAAVVEQAATKAKLFPRAIYELPWTTPNAFAFPLRRAIAFTDAALDTLSDKELEAVATHELAHLSEPTAMRWARPALGMYVATTLLACPKLSEFGWTGLGIAITALYAIVFGFRIASRRMESRADASVAVLQDSVAYGLALARLYEANLIPAVMGRGTTHPHLFDRLLSAGVRPPFPRPAPPRVAKTVCALMLVFGSVTLLLCSVQIDPGAIVWLPLRLAIRSDSATLANYALSRFRGGDVDASAALYRACTVLHEEEVYCAANLALVEAGAGRCDLAQTAMHEAARRLLDGATNAERQLLGSATAAVGRCASLSSDLR